MNADRIRCGVDVALIDSVADSIACFGDRYLKRIYTDHELQSATGSPLVRASRLAARFAAKEATIKVLQPTNTPMDWRDIEIETQPCGASQIHLTGRAADLAKSQEIDSFAVSFSHEAPLAVAVVVATLHNLD